MKNLLSNIVFIIFIISFFAGVLLKPNLEKTMGDFGAFLTGAYMLRIGEGQSLYELDNQYNHQHGMLETHIDKNDFLPFRNPPYFALILLPLTFVSIAWAYRIYLLAIMGLYLIMPFLFQKYLPNIRKLPLWSLAILFYYPNIESFLVSQITPFFVLLFFLIYVSLLKKRYLLTGLLAGLLSIKPQFLLSLPFLFFLSENKKKFLRGLLVVLVPVVIVSLAITGLNGINSYPKFLVASETSYFGSPEQRMFTIFSLIRNSELFAGVSLHKILAINLFIYFAMVALYFKFYKKVALELSFSSLLIFVLVFSVHLGLHDLGILTIVILMMMNLSIKYSRTRLIYGLIAAFLFIFPYFFRSGSVKLSIIVMFIFAVLPLGLSYKKKLM